MSKKKKRKLQEAATVVTPIAGKKKMAAAPAVAYMIPWLIVLVAVLPILFSDKTMDPVIPVRYIFLSAFALLFVLYFFIIKKQVTAIQFPLLNKAVLATAIGFVAWSIVAMWGAINYREGYYEIARYCLLIILIIIVWITTVQEETALLKLCKAIVFVAMFHALVGILQFYEIGFTKIPGANAKPYGLMANRNLFGSAQALLLPFVLFVLYKASRVWKWLASAALALLVFSLLLSQTRSAWLAAMAIIIGSLLLVMIFSPTNRKKWLFATTTGLACSALLIFLIMSGDSEGELKQSVQQRAKSLVKTDSTGDESVYNSNERLKIWAKTMKMIKDKPIMGAGPGNWRIAVAGYGTEGLVWAKGEYAPDQPHNVYLHVAAETGIPGAILYFGMWLLIAVVALYTILKPANEEQRILAILMLSGLATLATDAMFSFPMQRMEHTVYISIMAGIILGLHAKNNVVSKKIILKKGWIYTAVAILLFNLYLGYAKYNFETHMSKARQAEANHQYQEVLDEVEAGKSNLITLGPDVGTSLQVRSSEAYRQLKEMDKALAEIKIARQYHPNSSRVYNIMGTIYTDMGQFDKAIEAYQQGLKITPQYPILLKNLAVNYFDAKNFPACIATIGKMEKDADSNYFKSMIVEAQKYLPAK
ncbi:MAG TPA: O-antigen ligase family protein [Chitinophagaceae bacterium]